MVLQHAWLEIREIPGNSFREITQWISTFFKTNAQILDNLCRQIKYDPSYIPCWTKFLEYRETEGVICNRCTVYAHAAVFEPMLRTMIMDMAAAFPGVSFRGSFRLMHSNWGFSVYPFRTGQDILTWEEETLARQQPKIRKFWSAMQKSSCVTIRDLLEAMYAPMTGKQRYAAFFVLDDLFFDPEQEVSPTDGYDVDEEGNPELDSMVEFTYMCFLSHCWVDYGDIWEFFRVLKEMFGEKNVPFDFPADFLAALASQT